MEPVLCYGVPEGCSFGSIVALEWLGEPYALSRCVMPQDVDTDAFAVINPVRETPALVMPDGSVLTESLAILSHIAARGQAQGLGFRQGDATFDRLNQTLSFLVTTLFSGFGPLWRAFEGAPDKAALEALGRDEVTRAFGHLERLLGGRMWIAGTAEPTVADAYFIGIARWGSFHAVLEPGRYPRIDRLIARLEADPAVRFAHAIEKKGAEAEGGSPSGACKGHVKLADLVDRVLARRRPAAA